MFGKICWAFCCVAVARRQCAVRITLGLSLVARLQTFLLLRSWARTVALACANPCFTVADSVLIIMLMALALSSRLVIIMTEELGRGILLVVIASVLFVWVQDKIKRSSFVLGRRPHVARAVMHSANRQLHVRELAPSPLIPLLSLGPTCTRKKRVPSKLQLSPAGFFTHCIPSFT